MAININDETRKHLLKFLKKVLEDTYAQNELEDFAILRYQNKSYEHIRGMVVEMIVKVPGIDNADENHLSEDNRDSIEELVYELENKNL